MMADVLELAAMVGYALILDVREVFWLKRLKDWERRLDDFFIHRVNPGLPVNINQILNNFPLSNSQLHQFEYHSCI